MPYIQKLVKNLRLIPYIALTAFLLGNIQSGQAQGADALRYDIADVVDTLVDELAQGARQGQLALESLDPETQRAVRQIATGEDFRYARFSARTQVTALYNMANARAQGEGERFIAKLHRKLSGASGAVRLDADLQAISRKFTAPDLDRPLAFADAYKLAPADLRRPLPANVEAAVELLSRAMSPSDLGSIVTKMERHFRLDARGEPSRRVIDRAIVTSSDRKSALRQMINAHSPPPQLQRAMQILLIDVASKHAALGMDQDLVRTLKGLAEEPLPSDLNKFSEIGDSLPSRQAQRGASVEGNTISSPLSDSAARGKMAEILDQGGVEALQNNGGGGGGPSYASNRRAHADYVRRTHSGQHGVPRKYSLAIRSSKAARGVAVGAKVDTPSIRPAAAFWIPSVQDDRFGRLTISIPGREKLVVTRFLFADSFEAAVSTLWEDHGQEAAFKDGEITIVMSMDPDSAIAASQREQIIASAGERIVALGGQSATAEMVSILPRGIVIHPALHGRELAWSVARVDFCWFNDLNRLSVEAAKIAGKAMPAHLRKAFTGNARTWQFYERNGRIMIDEAAGAVDRLRLRSPSDGHFGVSLFAFGEERPSSSAQRDRDGVWRLVHQEKEVQPLLDWALTSHPDFMRLNDYSEALSVLRWLDRVGTRLVILDSDGEPQRIATPDRVFVGKVGPWAGE